MRSPLDVLLGRVGGYRIRQITRRTVPCYKYVEEEGGAQLAVCLLVDSRYLYRYPFKETKGVRALARKARYLAGEMEDLRLREYQPGYCRYVKHGERSAAASQA